MSHVRLEFDFRDYLREKAQESRQNEIQTILMFLVGALFFVGGILTILNITENPSWFLFIPYIPNLDAGSLLGLSLTTSGLLLMVVGIIVYYQYHQERKGFMTELKKGYESAVAKLNSEQSRQFVNRKNNKRIVSRNDKMSK